jgi:hypothetical protein
MIIWYVSPSGSDSSGDGTYLHPWKTFAYACTQVTTAGDIIRGSGGVFIETEQWVIESGVNIEGNIGNTTVISHYQGGDVNDALLYLSGGTNVGQYIIGIDFNGDNLLGGTCITVYDRSNIDFNYCTVKDFYRSGIRLTGDSAGNEGNKVHNCIQTNCGGGTGQDYESYLFIKNQTGFEYYSNTLIQTFRGSGLSRDAIRYEEGNRGCKIYNNNLTGLWGGDDWTFLFEAWENTKTDVGYGLEIHHNTIVGLFDFGSGTRKGTYVYSVWWHHNTSGENVTHGPDVARTGLEFEEICYDIRINNSTFKNLDRSIYFCRNNTDGDFRRVNIHNNIIRDVPYSYSNVDINGTKHAFGAGIVFAGEYSNAHLEDILIRNNAITAYGAAHGGVGVWIDTRGTVSNVALQGNIIQGFAEAPYGTVDGGGSWDGLIEQNNILYKNGNNNALLTGNINITNKTTSGLRYEDPLFVSNSDYHSQSMSQAINHGIAFEDILLDYDDNVIDVADIGPYDYGGVPPEVTLVDSITVTGVGGVTTITTDNGTLQMVATVLPEGATDKSVTWSVISGTGTGSINSTGLLTAITDGTVTVRATANDGSAVYG